MGIPAQVIGSQSFSDPEKSLRGFRREETAITEKQFVDEVKADVLNEREPET